MPVLIAENEDLLCMVVNACVETQWHKLDKNAAKNNVSGQESEPDCSVRLEGTRE